MEESEINSVLVRVFVPAIAELKSLSGHLSDIGHFFIFIFSQLIGIYKLNDGISFETLQAL
jgi:hypothetical protein